MEVVAGKGAGILVIRAVLWEKLSQFGEIRFSGIKFIS